jgi:hypothetical protein
MGDLHNEILGAVGFSIPAGWDVQQQLLLQLPCAAPDDIAFRPNVVMRIQSLAPGVTLEAVEEERWRTLEQHLSGFERGLALWGQLFGERAVRMTYAWQHGTHALRQVLVLWVLEGRLYELTFSEVASRFDRTVVEFERWLSGLSIASPERSIPSTGEGAGPASIGRDLSALFPGASR